MATVKIQKYEKRNGVSYQIKYKDPFSGKSKYYKTFEKLKDAQLASHELRAIIDSGKITEIKTKQKKKNLLTFEQITSQLRDTWQKRHEDGDLSSNTFDGYTVLADVLNFHFGSQLLIEISKDDIEQFRSNIRKRYSAVYANRLLFILKQIFKQGIISNAIIEDCSVDIRKYNEKQHERNKYILPGEIEKLVMACECIRSKFYLSSLIYLGAEHGASKQESLDLKWSDIDFVYQDSGIIRFYRTKTCVERTQPIMPNTKQALLDWWNHLEWMRKRKKIKVVEDQYVFCRLNGIRIKSFYRSWDHACKLAGIKDFHFHDLRHTYCSNMILSGAGLKDVKEMIGHRDLSMTDRYSHLTDDHKAKLQHKLAEHYGKSKVVKE